MKSVEVTRSHIHMFRRYIRWVYVKRGPSSTFHNRHKPIALEKNAIEYRITLMTSCEFIMLELRLMMVCWWSKLLNKSDDMEMIEEL